MKIILLFFFCLGYPFIIKSKLKDLYSCAIEITKGLTDNGQFQYLTE